MLISDSRIDAGNAFDWGRVSAEYARYRDIYPALFYEKITRRGFCLRGQKWLDIGTGTGVIPRNLYESGADWTATDISPEQIAQAKRLAKEAGMEIDFRVCAAEALSFPPAIFDGITACQCFFYFDEEKVLPLLAELLKPGGALLLLYLAWLPEEDAVAGASEELVRRYNPNWSGGGETRHPIRIPECASPYFALEDHEEYDLRIPFMRQTWHGRMRACRGVGASLLGAELENWEREHTALLERIAPEEFEVQHYAAIAVLRKRG